MNQSRELKRKSDSYFAEFADEFYYTLLANEMPNNRTSYIFTMKKSYGELYKI